MKLYRIAIVALGAIALSGCSTYQAKTRYQAEMLRLCAEQGAPWIYRVVELPSDAFRGGQVKFERSAPGAPLKLTVAGRFEHRTKESYLKVEPEHHLALRLLESSYVDMQTGEVLGAQKRFCRDGGDSLAPNNTIECCPSTTSLTTTLFKEAGK